MLYAYVKTESSGCILMASTKPQPTLFKKSNGLRGKGRKALSIPDLGCYLITEEAWFPWLNWAGVMTPGRVPLTWIPSTPALSGLLCLGPQSLVHPKDAGIPSDLEDLGKLTNRQGSWCWGPQFNPPS